MNIRMTVLKLRDGSLFVYGPVAPTRECLRLLRELNAPVKYIVLPTSAVEHKARAFAARGCLQLPRTPPTTKCSFAAQVFLGPFAREFPDAEARVLALPRAACSPADIAPLQIYAAPGQWSWPLNLPLALLGLFPRKLNGTLGDGGLSDGRRAPWADELEHALLELPLGLGPFVEVVFFHKASKTLLVTDLVISVPEEPPQVCAADPLPLLVRSKDTVEPLPENTSDARLVGWAKTVLFALFFQPRAVSFGLRGFTWSPEWRDSFARLTRPKLIVPPILQTIVLNKRPATARTWINRVARWPFQRIIPAHLEAPISAGPADFVAAFDFLPQKNTSAWVNPFAAVFAKPQAAAGAASPFAEGDMRTLRSIGNLVSVLGVIKGAFLRLTRRSRAAQTGFDGFSCIARCLSLNSLTLALCAARRRVRRSSEAVVVYYSFLFLGHSSLRRILGG